MSHEWSPFRPALAPCVAEANGELDGRSQTTQRITLARLAKLDPVIRRRKRLLTSGPKLVLLGVLLTWRRRGDVLGVLLPHDVGGQRLAFTAVLLARLTKLTRRGDVLPVLNGAGQADQADHGAGLGV